MGDNRKPLTERHHQLLDMPTIESQFPVEFGNGNGVDEFEGFCSGCGESIPQNMLRGVIKRPFPQVAILEAAGVCLPCKLLTDFDNRIYDDMRVTALRNGVWCTWTAESSFFESVCDWFRKLLKSF